MKTTNRNLKAIIFDMDGVLIDSEPLHLTAMQEFLRGMNVDYSEEMNREFLGRKDLLIAEILIQRFSLKLSPHEFVERKEKILQRLLQNQSVARPGVHSLLNAAKNAGIPMAVASSATLAAIQLVMRVLSIREYFLHFCSGEEVEHSKPSPDIFLLAAKRLDLPPDSCMVIEDSLNGLKAAKSAGMFSIAIPCAATAHQDHSIADMNLSSLEELPLDELFGYNSLK